MQGAGPRKLIPPSAVVFDLDGTLVDSGDDIAAAMNHALTAIGRTTRPAEEIRRFVGDGARMLVVRALDTAPDAPLADQALEHFRAYYAAHPTFHTKVLPGVESLLRVLGEIPKAVVTNKPRALAEQVLVGTGLAPYFRVVRGGGDGPLKPDPALVVAALDSLGVAPRHAWMIGDGAQDVLAGRAAGCVTVLVTGGLGDEARAREARPDETVASLEALAASVRQPGP